ncbi:pantoate--beta-alanine ligase [Tepidibacillus sp. LV47]|uniref:pantoate--beta-alanine ligase n=1 Tax=Tepidibacillus sp. LV47 TaxID=3398228 RepID=UPI003AAC56E3
MEVITTINEIRTRIAKEKKAGKVIGLVPTMGYLHRGHQSLIEKARKESDFVVVSIFVNPLQFGPNEDYDRYPRDLERDKIMAKQAGADLIFFPSVNEMYPAKPKTFVEVNELTAQLCGKSRPGHFRGVTTVVSKLFHIIQPDMAYFGLKDAQQVAVIQQMVQDLNMPITIIPCPIVREEDGLALSSRNVYLSPEERNQATILYQSLQKAKEWIEEGITETRILKDRIRSVIETQSLARIDYVEILSFPSLEPVGEINETSQTIIALAVWFGKTRLIDNLIIDRNEV